MLQSHSLYFLLIFIFAVLLEIRHPYHVRRYLCVAISALASFVSALFFDGLFIPCVIFPIMCVFLYCISLIKKRKITPKSHPQYAIALADIPKNGKGAVYTHGKTFIVEGTNDCDIKKGQVIYIDE